MVGGLLYFRLLFALTVMSQDWLLVSPPSGTAVFEPAVNLYSCISLSPPAWLFAEKAASAPSSLRCAKTAGCGQMSPSTRPVASYAPAAICPAGWAVTPSNQPLPLMTSRGSPFPARPLPQVVLASLLARCSLNSLGVRVLAEASSPLSYFTRGLAWTPPFAP